MNLQKLFKVVEAEQVEQGFVGMDFRMMTMCIIAQRIPEIKVPFKEGGTSTYEEKLEYWAGKWHWRYKSKDHVLEEAAKHYGVE